MTLSSERLVPPQARCRWARIRAQDAAGARGRSIFRQARRKPDAKPDATPHVNLGDAQAKGGAGVLAAVASIALDLAKGATDAAGADGGEEQIPIAKATVTHIDASTPLVSPMTERSGASPPPLSPRTAAAACMCSLAPTARFGPADATPPSSIPAYGGATPLILPPPPPEEQEQEQEQEQAQAQEQEQEEQQHHL